MDLLSILPESLVAVVIILGVAWILEDRVGYNKGVRLGPYEWVLKTDRIYYRIRRSVSDVTFLIFQNQDAIINSIKEELDSPYFEESGDSQHKDRIRQALKKVSILRDPQIAFQAFMLGSLLHGRILLYVISRKRDKKTGEPRPFPSGQALVAKRPVMTFSGLQSRRLVEGDFVLLQKKHRVYGLIGRPTPIGLFVPDEDADDREVILQLERMSQPLQDFAVAIRTEKQYGTLLKDMQRRLKNSQAEQKRLINRLRTSSGESQADKRTTEWYERNTPKGAKIGNSLTPVVMFLFPVFGAAAAEYGLRVNPIIGVILGAALAMMIVGFRGK